MVSKLSRVISDSQITLFFVWVAVFFCGGPSAQARLEVWDMIDVPALFPRGAVTPLDGLLFLHELEMMRLHTPGNFGPYRAPYPCHHQIISSGHPDRDCPQGWPQALTQFLYPSFDGKSFVANQGSIHDPLSRLSLKTIGDLLCWIQGVERVRLREMPYFLEMRNQLVRILSPTETPLEKFESIRQGTLVSNLYLGFTQNDSSTPEFYFLDFVREELKLKTLFPPIAWKGYDALLDDRARVVDLEVGVARRDKRASNGNYGRFLKRNVSENFANALLGTMLLSLEVGKEYYSDFVERALYSYLVSKYDSREDLLHLLRENPTLAHPDTAVTLLSAHSESGDVWSKRTFDRNYLLEWEEIASRSEFEGGLIDRLSMDQWAFLVQGRDRDFPVLRPYGRAQVQLRSVKDEEVKVVTHSDCGESVIRYLMGLGLFDPSTGRYDPRLWDAKVKRFKLSPSGRSGSGAIRNFFAGPDGKGRDARFDSKQESHDAWATDVMSYLEEVLYSKPPAKSSVPSVCEIVPGVDNVLVAWQQLLGDKEDEEPIHGFSPKSDLWSLETLSRYEAFELEGAHRDVERRRIQGQYRKLKFDRIFRIISPDAPDPKHKISWFGPNPDNELPDNFTTLVLFGFMGRCEWTIQEGHFSLVCGRLERIDWKQGIFPKMIEVILSEIMSGNRSRLGLLHSFLSVDHLPNDSIFLRSFQTQPELIFAFPLRTAENRVKVATWALEHHVSSLYPWIEAWMLALEPSETELRFVLGGTFERVLDREIVFGDQLILKLISRVLTQMRDPLSLVFSSRNSKEFHLHVFNSWIASTR